MSADCLGIVDHENAKLSAAACRPIRLKHHRLALCEEWLLDSVYLAPAGLTQVRLRRLESRRTFHGHRPDRARPPSGRACRTAAVLTPSSARSGSLIGTERRRRPWSPGDQATAAGVRLPPRGQQPARKVNVTHLQVATSLIRNVVARLPLVDRPIDQPGRHHRYRVAVFRRYLFHHRHHGPDRRWPIGRSEAAPDIYRPGQPASNRLAAREWGNRTIGDDQVAPRDEMIMSSGHRGLHRR